MWNHFMRRIRAVALRIFGAFHAHRQSADFASELESHIALHVEDGIRAGLSPDEARRQALVRLGGAEQTKQAYRERVGLPLLGTFVRDIRFGVRMLAKNPGFTWAAVLTLALGIGANTAIFSLIDALFLKPLALPHAERLVRIFARGPLGHYGAGFSLPEFQYLRDHASSFSALSAEDHFPQLNLETGGGSVEVNGAFVSADYFDVVQVQPRLGRSFLPAEDSVANRDAVAVISDQLWKVHFNSDPAILGRQAKINGVLFTVIGVAPAGFHGDQMGQAEDVWVPSMMLGSAGYGCADGSNNCSLIDAIVGRLAPDVSPLQAQAQAMSTVVWSATDWPERPSRRQIAMFPASAEWPDSDADDVAQMRLLMAVTVSLLLIACANLAGLLLARGVTRKREIALRLAIGARRSRIIRQLLTESLLLACCGGLLGVGFSFGVKGLLSQFYSTDSEGFHHLYDLSFDWRVLLYSLGLTVAMGLLFGVIPAIRASRQHLVSELKEGPAASGPIGGRLRNLLVIGQIALSMVLVVSAALLARSGMAIERGTNFDPGHMVVLRLRPELLKYTPLQVRSLVTEVSRRLGATPGIESVAFMQGGEGLVWKWQSGRDAQVSLPGELQAARHAGLTVPKQDISPNFFRTLRTPLMQGREFSAEDRPDSPSVAIVNQALAMRLWPAGTALGRTLIVNGQSFQVIGMTADIQPPNSVHAPEPHLYLSYWQSNSIREGDIRLAIRIAGDPALALPAIRRVIQDIDSAVPIGEDMPMTQQVRLEYTPVLLARGVLSYCGMLALCLSGIGFYSILAFMVRTRTREIGIRMALGARRPDVLRMVVAQGARLALVGVIAGIGSALMLTRLEASLLFGVRTSDPSTYGCVALLIFVVALAACFFPARRAASIDPTQALRME
jgi:predicted permease